MLMMMLSSPTRDVAVELVLVVARQGVAADHLGAVIDHPGVAADRQGASADRPGATDARQDVVVNRLRVAGIRQVVTTDRQGAAIDRQGATANCQGAAADCQGAVVDCWSLGCCCRLPVAEMSPPTAKKRLSLREVLIMEVIDLNVWIFMPAAWWAPTVMIYDNDLE
jgi:hypothetical protein